MPTNNNPRIGIRLTATFRAAAWSFLNSDGALVTYLPFGDADFAETYGRGWNDAVLRAGREELLVAVAIAANAEAILLRSGDNGVPR